MRIGYDVRPFLKEETGVGVYFKNLLAHLALIDALNEYFLFSSSWKDRFPEDKIPPFQKKKFRDVRFPVKAVNFFWYRFGWPPLDMFFRTELDLTHSPGPLLLPTKGKKIVTVHDFFFLDSPGKADEDARIHFVKNVRKSLREADGILTFSLFMRNDIMERFDVEEDKVKVIYHGLDSRFCEKIPPEDIEKTRQKYNLPQRFLLFVGAIEPRKNLLKLVDALKIIHIHHGEVHLVLAGRMGGDYSNLRQRAKEINVERWVKFLGYIPERDLTHLYRLASLLVFPSLCEGFGFPLVEAMASGLPVAASLNSALPEVGGDAALYFRPDNPESIAEKVGAILENEGLRRDLVTKGLKRSLDFDWNRTARETLDFYYSFLGRA